MKKYKYPFLALLFISFVSFAHNREIPIDTIVTTYHTTTIKGKNVNYQAKTGTQPVWNEDGKPIATLFYTYYKRTDLKKILNAPYSFLLMVGRVRLQFGCI